MPALSTVATYDELRRWGNVLTDGAAEEAFFQFLRAHDGCRQQLTDAVAESQRLQRELDSALKTIADFESKLHHARTIIDTEHKARKKAEQDCDVIEKKMWAVTDILQNEHINDETRKKISVLHENCRKRKSQGKRRDLNDINSTRSVLSDLSLTQSEDDILNVTSDRWKKHRPSTQEYVGRRSRLSTDKRKSGNISKHQNIELTGTDRIVAHTKVTVPQGDGPILAESIIEAIPQQENDDEIFSYPKRKSPARSPFTPSAPPVEDTPLSLPRHLLTTRYMMRPHQFASRTFLRSDECLVCQKKISFGSMGLRCRDCRVCVHNNCREDIQVACVPQAGGTPTNKGGTMGLISDYTPNVSPMIPALIVHCVTEIETRGLNEVGIYRVPGSDREVKALKERFLRGKALPYLTATDVHVLCGCIKDFLRSLKEPLIPTALWRDFSNAVSNVNKSKLSADLYAAIGQLPQANRDTLAFLMQHFQRIAEIEAVKMPQSNIAKVFGPTIVGYFSSAPDQHAMYAETMIQVSVMENLLRIPTEYWSQFLHVDYNKETESESNGTRTFFGTPSFRSARKERKYYATPPYPKSASKKTMK